MEKCSRFSTEDKVSEGMVGVADKMKNITKNMPQVGVLWRPSFLSDESRLPKSFDLYIIFLGKKCSMLSTMSFSIHA